MDSGFSVISTAILLLFILDPFGNIPLLLSVLKNVDRKKHRAIIIREMLIGLAILLFFLFLGDRFLSIFGLETQAITISGGIIFFVIALKMIFPDPKGHSLFTSEGEDDPLVVPIAIPMVSGPGAIATVMVIAKSHPNHLSGVFLSVLIAWALVAAVLLASPLFYRLLQKRGLTAMERLMGMLLLMMAVEMFINGVRDLIPTF
ncbi:MAG TPA: NAAT family transporter [Nitratifractor sp.]|nr:NAAT family transporter [Nitratifractor sp.]